MSTPDLKSAFDSVCDRLDAEYVPGDVEALFSTLSTIAETPTADGQAATVLLAALQQLPPSAFAGLPTESELGSPMTPPSEKKVNLVRNEMGYPSTLKDLLLPQIAMLNQPHHPVMPVVAPPANSRGFAFERPTSTPAGVVTRTTPPVSARGGKRSRVAAATVPTTSIAASEAASQNPSTWQEYFAVPPTEPQPGWREAVLTAIFCVIFASLVYVLSGIYYHGFTGFNPFGQISMVDQRGSQFQSPNALKRPADRMPGTATYNQLQQNYQSYPTATSTYSPYNEVQYPQNPIGFLPFWFNLRVLVPLCIVCLAGPLYYWLSPKKGAICRRLVYWLAALIGIVTLPLIAFLTVCYFLESLGHSLDNSWGRWTLHATEAAIAVINTYQKIAMCVGVGLTLLVGLVLPKLCAFFIELLTSTLTIAPTVAPAVHPLQPRQFGGLGWGGPQSTNGNDGKGKYKLSDYQLVPDAHVNEADAYMLRRVDKNSKIPVPDHLVVKVAHLQGDPKLTNDPSIFLHGLCHYPTRITTNTCKERIEDFDAAMLLSGMPEGWDLEFIRSHFDDFDEIRFVGQALGHELEHFSDAPITARKIAVAMESDEEYTQRLLKTPGITTEEILRSSQERTREQRRKNIRDRHIPAEVWAMLKTINDLRQYMMETSGREKQFRIAGDKPIPENWKTMPAWDINMILREWRDDVWAEYMKGKGIDFGRCNKCGTVGRLDNHQCFHHEASKPQYIGGLPHKERIDAISQGGKISTKTSMVPAVDVLMKNLQENEKKYADKPHVQGRFRDAMAQPPVQGNEPTHEELTARRKALAREGIDLPAQPKVTFRLPVEQQQVRDPNAMTDVEAVTSQQQAEVQQQSTSSTVTETETHAMKRRSHGPADPIVPGTEINCAVVCHGDTDVPIITMPRGMDLRTSCTKLIESDLPLYLRGEERKVSSAVVEHGVYKVILVDEYEMVKKRFTEGKLPSMGEPSDSEK